MSMNAGNERASESPLFSATITPYRSLGRKGFIIVMCALGGISFVAGMVFLMAGAWPVFGFFGLDVLLVYWAFKANYRAARAYETVTVTPSELIVRQVGRRGAVTEMRFNPLWVTLEREPDPEFNAGKLFLVSRGRRFAIAGYLSPKEKDSFATALQAALHEARRGPTRTVFP
jgi:uncharacterized membrane protein